SAVLGIPRKVRNTELEFLELFFRRGLLEVILIKALLNRPMAVIPIPFLNYEITAHEREHRLFNRPTSESNSFHASQHLLIISS
uniref:hypothetical protein n=1 Tax=Endozoicomonas atrinae TaxID=1333660 RepID=UPI001EE71BBD